MKKIFTLLSIITLGNIVNAQLLLASHNTAVIENFNGIGSTATATLPSNWFVAKDDATARVKFAASAVTGTTTTARSLYATAISSTATNGIYNFGGSNDDTDRAVGGLSAGGGSKTVAVLTSVKNTSTFDYDKLNVSFNVEKYRNGSNVNNYEIRLWYSTDGTTWSDSGLAAVFVPDANNNGSITPPISTVAVSGSINTTLAVNATMYLQWVYTIVLTNTTGNGQALGIDDVSISGFTNTLAVREVTKSKNLFLKNTVVENVLSFQAKGAASVKIYNVNGQLIKSAIISSSNSDLNLSSLSKGNYIVTAESEGEKISQKIMKK